MYVCRVKIENRKNNCSVPFPYSHISYTVHKLIYFIYMYPLICLMPLRATLCYLLFIAVFTLILLGILMGELYLCTAILQPSTVQVTFSALSIKLPGTLSTQIVFLRIDTHFTSCALTHTHTLTHTYRGFQYTQIPFNSTPKQRLLLFSNETYFRFFESDFFS